MTPTPANPPTTVDHLADSVSKLGIGTAYGEPIDIGGTKVTPVALTWFGFGAGPESGAESATAGGGGGASIPIGVYQPGPDGPVFKPNLIALLAVSIPVLWVGGRAFTSIIKALKK